MITNIELKNIKPSGFNPRKTFSEEALNELAASIKEQGVLQPIVVRPKGKNKYEIVCGERRYRASVIAESKDIPAIVRELTDDEAMDVAITENLQRKDVDPLEEAAAFKMLIGKGQTIEDLATRFGKSGAYIRGRLKLNDLIPEFVDLINRGEINVSQGLELCKYGKILQEEMYREHYSDNASYYQKWNDLSVKELKIRLQQYRIDLENAKFDRIDCFKCPDNTGYSCLFPELEKVSCNNSKCFKNKTEEYLKNEAIRIMENEPEVILFIDQYSLDKNDPVTSFILGKGGVVECNMNWIIKHEPIMPGKPERDEYDEDEEGEKEYQIALEEYPQKVEEYEKKLKEYKQNIQSGNVRKAFVVAGYHNVGEYLYVKPSYSARHKIQNTLNNSEEIILAELRNKDKRNGEIAFEKTLTEAKNVFSNALDENKHLSPMTDFEEKLLYFYMLEHIRDSHRKQFDIKSGYYVSDEEKIKILEELTEEKKMIILRDFLFVKLVNSAFKKDQLGDWALRWMKEYEAEKITEIELRHKETYLKRKEKIDAKIAEIELQKVEGKK